jgi:beta-glucosidase
MLRNLRLLLVTTSLLSAATPEEIERRINDLLARMTLAEKLGQMSQSSNIQAPLNDKIKDQIREGRWGSFLNAGLTRDRAEAQRIARTESRLHIPLLFGRDVIHGYRTVFPIPLGQATSWDPGLIREAARMAAREASYDGIHWTFAPMLDVSREPRWGRIAESLGEDPYLTSALGVAMIQGFQGKSLDAPGSLAACAKHYVGYGATEGGRDYNTTWIPEVLLRDVYLPPFHAAVKAGVASVMTGFNNLNGVPVSGNVHTIREILRQEWNFRGLVVSDWDSVLELTYHGYAADLKDAALKGLAAGVEMEMDSTTYHDHLTQANAQLIDEAVRDILRLKLRLGLFDAPVPDPSAARELAAPDPEALTTARKLSTESVVLLKNERGTLPLTASVRKIAMIGPLANSPLDQMGTWVMDGRPDDVRTPLAALQEMLGPDRTAFAAGLKNSRDMSHDGFPAAVTAVRSADAVLLFLGEEQILSGEAHARAFLDLPGAQEALVDEVIKARKPGAPIVAIIQAGRPLTFHNVAAKVDAILYAFHPGTMGGPALVDLVFGRANPSGKLTVTFPRAVGQVPIYYAHYNTGRPATAANLGIPPGTPQDPKGYTSNYLDLDFTPEYPFGFGLSYTTFEYSNLRIAGHAVTADISNTGTRAGDEIVQFYIRKPPDGITHPVRELKGFQRLHLEPREKRSVSFMVDQPGSVQAWIGADSNADWASVRLP